MVCEFVLYVMGKLGVYFKKNFDFGHKISVSVCQCVSVNTIPVTQKPMGQST